MERDFFFKILNTLLGRKREKKGKEGRIKDVLLPPVLLIVATVLITKS